MIEHIVHFFKAEFTYTWHLNLPFRIIKGDEIHYELLINKGKLQYDKELSDEFFELKFDEFLFVEDLQIDHNGDIVVWLDIPKT